MRTPNPEIPEGSIALVATNNNKVQQPPNTLDRIHASREKQIAFNKRVLKNEDEVGGINRLLSDFLQGNDGGETLLGGHGDNERRCGTLRYCRRALLAAHA
jgi:hypothetical protein